jgi:PhnB protein
MTTIKSNAMVRPYLFFNGRCEQAVEFYCKALGAEVEMMMRYKDSPEPPRPGMVPLGFEHKIMHCSFHVGGTRLMASDGNSPDQARFAGFSLALTVDTEAEADRCAEAGRLMKRVLKWCEKGCFEEGAEIRQGGCRRTARGLRCKVARGLGIN